MDQVRGRVPVAQVLRVPRAVHLPVPELDVAAGADRHPPHGEQHRRRREDHPRGQPVGQRPVSPASSPRSARSPARRHYPASQAPSQPARRPPLTAPQPRPRLPHGPEVPPMKLATLRDRSRDGRLVVVSRDLTLCSDARHLAPTLQAALDAWDEVAPELERIARGLETGGQPASASTSATPSPRSPAPTTAPTPAAATAREPSPPPRPGRARPDHRRPRRPDRRPRPRRRRRRRRPAIRLLVLTCQAAGAAALAPAAVTPDAFARRRLLRPATRLPEHPPDLGALVALAAPDRALAAGCLVAGPAPSRRRRRRTSASRCATPPVTASSAPSSRARPHDRPPRRPLPRHGPQQRLGQRPPARGLRGPRRRRLRRAPHQLLPLAAPDAQPPLRRRRLLSRRPRGDRPRPRHLPARRSRLRPARRAPRRPGRLRPPPRSPSATASRPPTSTAASTSTAARTA